MPIRFRSRQVKCMLMSRPVGLADEERGREDGHPDARPSDPSLMSTTSTPRSARSFAPCTSFSMLWPRGGSSSTVTRNSRAWSRERSRDGSAVTPARESLPARAGRSAPP